MITTKVNDDSNQQQFMVQSFYSSKNMFRIAPVLTTHKSIEDPLLPNPGTEGTYSTGKDGESPNSSHSPQEDTSTAVNAAAAANRRLSRLSLTGQMLSNNSQGTSSSFQGDQGEMVPMESLKVAPSAKFYPLLCELMKRGDQTAAATTQFLNKNSAKTEKVSHMLSKATQYTQEQSSHIMEQASQAMSSTQQGDKEVGTTTDGTNQIANKVKQVVNEEEVKQLITMIKDEDLTVLLKKGKERLELLLQKDIPRATELALQKTGIRLSTEQDEASIESPYRRAIVQSQQAALKSLQQLLDQAEVDPKDLEAVRDSLGANFNQMFDSLTQAAKSDRRLASILETLNDRTAAWQEATGRLMATKSASLFLEGASRIQARAANLFSKDQLQWAGAIGSKFTKAFTEGDAAVARIKSIELGEKVRDRLVEAIEVRSESLGGLDGIIAGALTTMKGTGSGTQMKDMLTTLQARASTATKDANETLISVLAGRSEYRDIALLKVEQTLCDLESQFGEDMSPEDIAALARGEGGTAKLFEPIAKKAAKEIEKQLNVAEAAVSDPTMIEVLKQVRKIVSGELTLQAVMDDVVNILNDDNVVAAGENLVKQGEQVLDAIEGVSGNKVVDDVLQMVEKAGITKDKVMEGIEKLDVNELLVRAPGKRMPYCFKDTLLTFSSGQCRKRHFR